MRRMSFGLRNRGLGVGRLHDIGSVAVPAKILCRGASPVQVRDRAKNGQTLIISVRSLDFLAIIDRAGSGGCGWRKRRSRHKDHRKNCRRERSQILILSRSRQFSLLLQR
jgi:hypothetical protein